MTKTYTTEHWAELCGRAVWDCAPSGFAYATPLPGARSIAAVGSLDPAAMDTEDTRAAIGEVLRDVALTEGHDVHAVFALANAALAIEDLGAVHSLALFTGGEGIRPFVTGAGGPTPLVVTADRLSASAEPGSELGPGWTVVLGTRLPGQPPVPVLPSSDVRAALRLVASNGNDDDDHDGDGGGSSERTLLAVRIEAAGDAQA